jgi:methionine sulfoxide reductase heme-binding subunit
MSSATLWYLSRSTGIVLLVVLSLTAVLGAALGRHGRLPWLPRFGVVELHRNATMLALSLLTVHVVTAVVDPYVDLGWLAVVVPFVAGYQPLWTGLGALALDLVVAVAVTSLLRRRIGWRAWRATHWLAYAAWPLAVVHGLGAADDLHSGGLLVLAVGCIAAVVAAVAWRWWYRLRDVVAAGLDVLDPPDVGRLPAQHLAGPVVGRGVVQAGEVGEEAQVARRLVGADAARLDA